MTLREAILVTGGAGYIGSATCKHLCDIGFMPVTLDNLSTGHREFVKWGPFFEGDISDEALVKSIVGEYAIRAIVHFAASAYVGESVKRPGKYFLNNVVAGTLFLETLQKLGVNKIVFSSSCATYGIPNKTPIVESMSQLPINPYGDTKLYFEKMLRWYGAAHGMTSVVLRYFNAAGADPLLEVGERHDPETHVIPLIIAACRGKMKSFRIFGDDYDTPDGTAIRDYVHVGDLAGAHGLALKYLLNGKPSISFNLGTGRGHSVLDVIGSVQRVSGKTCPVVNEPRRVGDPPVLVADPNHARAILKWHPQYINLDDIVKTAWDWDQLDAHSLAAAQNSES